MVELRNEVSNVGNEASRSASGGPRGSKTSMGKRGLEEIESESAEVGAASRRENKVIGYVVGVKS
jgi:hypothetical protein